MRPESESDEILTEWAEVEGVLNRAKDRLDTLAPQSDEATATRQEIDGLIDEWAILWNRYQRLISTAEGQHLPPPGAWPEGNENAPDP
jgi:hypothetical protein